MDRSFGRKHDLGGWLEIIAEEDAGGRRIAAVVDRGGAKVGLDRAEPILAPARLRPDIGALEGLGRRGRSEEHTSALQSLMRNSYAVFCLIKKNTTTPQAHHTHHPQLK